VVSVDEEHIDALGHELVGQRRTHQTTTDDGDVTRVFAHEQATDGTGVK
jgi:hypothetical protein